MHKTDISQLRRRHFALTQCNVVHASGVHWALAVCRTLYWATLLMKMPSDRQALPLCRCCTTSMNMSQ